jgi:hypothetical protein
MIANKTTKEKAYSTTEVLYLTPTFTLGLLAAVTLIHRDPFMWLKREGILKIKHCLYTGLTPTSYY